MGGYQGVVVLAGVFVVACGGPSGGGSVGNGGISDSAGASTNQGGSPSAGGSSSTGGAPRGGAAGATAGGGSAGGGLGPVSCQGDFGSPTVVLAGETGVPVASPSLSPDTLELFYVRESKEEHAFRRSTRADDNAMFTAGAPVPELDAACAAGESRTIGLSSDGLRAYVVCYAADPNALGGGVLHVADRASQGAAFTLRAGTAMVGPSAAISSDELTLYTSSDVDPGSDPPRRYRRAATTAEFGSGEDIPGLSVVNLSAPDPSPDELELFGALDTDLVVTTRATRDGAFGEPRILLPHVENAIYGAPEISRDCRSLFVVRQTRDSVLYSGEILVMRR